MLGPCCDVCTLRAPFLLAARAANHSALVHVSPRFIDKDGSKYSKHKRHPCSPLLSRSLSLSLSISLSLSLAFSQCVNVYVHNLSLLSVLLSHVNVMVDFKEKKQKRNVWSPCRCSWGDRGCPTEHTPTRTSTNARTHTHEQNTHIRNDTNLTEKHIRTSRCTHAPDLLFLPDLMNWSTEAGKF